MPARDDGAAHRASKLNRLKLERAKGFEPSTPTLARSCSTPELHPHPLGCRPSGPSDAKLCQKAGCFATAAEKGEWRIARSKEVRPCSSFLLFAIRYSPFASATHLTHARHPR